MSTYTATQETRLIFTLRDEAGTGFKQRIIVIPGAVANEGNLQEVLRRFKVFRYYILTGKSSEQDATQYYEGVNFTQFIQPTNWRDETGSTETTDMDTYTTTDVEIEFYTTTKNRYGADDLPA